MRNLKNKLIIGLLALEGIVFGVVYLFGSHGIEQLKKAQAENKALQVEVDELKGSVARLEKQLQDWEQDGFYKEKVARERLHLAKPNEHIYHLA